MRKITFNTFWFSCLVLFVSLTAAAQQPTVSATSPTVVTYRTTMTITGTNFGSNTTVSFYANGTSGATVAPLSTTVNSSSQITVVVPAVVAAGGASATKYYKVTRVVSGTTYNSTPVSYTFTPPAQTPSTAVVNRIITNYNGYWSSGTSGSGYATSNVQPDTQHSLFAFRYGNKLYSTGSEAAITNTLGGANATTTGEYVAGNWRAIPVNNISGNVPASSSVYLVLAGMIDGSANTSVPTAPSVQGLSARDVLIDGTRGLGLGTGLTNLPSTSPLTFTAGNILENKAGDEIPDILVTQVAQPTDNAFTTYCFVNAAGNIVGNPVEINMSSISKLGTYKSDFFTLSSQSFNSATVNGAGYPGGNTRDIRMLAYKLSDFGITNENRGEVTQFKVLTNGTDDMAFMAYNRDTFTIPAPEIASQPSSQAICPGGTANFTVTVTSTGTGTETASYQWEKNGIALINGATGTGSTVSGATGATLSISNISAADYAIYRCVVTNSVGAAFSNSAYLNSVFLNTTASAATCQNTAVTLETAAVGNTPQYQWYMSANNGTSNTTTGGTAISGATSATYAPSVATAGVKYYYVQAYPADKSCAPATSAAIPVTVYATSVAGTVSNPQTVCPNTPATVSVSGFTGTIQWQMTTASDNTGWTDIAGANSASYTNTSVTETTYYRAVVTSGNCGSATSSVTSVAPNTTYIWYGTTSTNWNTASNWSCNLIPTLAVDVTIPASAANQPVVNNDGTALAKSLLMEANAHLTVATGASLRVANSINVGANAVLTVQNNGALLQDNEAANTGIITVLRDSHPLFRLDYTLWSSPVSGQLLKTFSPLTLSNRYYEYKYDTNGTNYLEAYWAVDANTTYFTAGKGFLIRMPNSDAATGYNEGNTPITHHGTFTGIPFNGTIQVPMSTQANHYTATGNPYASPINVAEFFAQNSTVLENGSPIYLWRKRNNEIASSYATLTLAGLVANTGIIAGTATPGYASGGQDQIGYYPAGQSANYILSQGQGFIVKTAPGLANPQLTFSNSMRRIVPVTGQQAFLKSAATTNARLWINMANNNGQFSQAAVAYMGGATMNIDFGYDGLRLTDSNLSLYTLAAESTLAIQARPEFEPTDVVPVGYKATEAGTFTINLDHVDGTFENGQKIYLNDKVEGIVRELTAYSYTFTTEAGTFNDRFEIKYANGTTNTDTALGTDANVLDANAVIVYKKDNAININTGTVLMNGVTVYDMRGRVLYSNDKVNGSETSITDLTAQQQVLIVEINTVKGKVSKKVLF